jgi:hypothetical protein
MVSVLTYRQPNQTTKTVNECQKVIRRVAGQLIQEKKRKITEGEASGKGYQAKDLLTLLSKLGQSNSHLQQLTGFDSEVQQ